MAEEKPSRKRRRRPTANDIAPVLQDWEYEPGTINVRKVPGLDGAPKIQMRLDLGLLQMEVDGRPDGSRPHGCDSLLDYYEKRLHEHCRRNGTDLGFHLTGRQCQMLREEAMMYYHRYLSLFVLGEFEGVARDTERNLRVLDLCGRFAIDEQDRLVLEQYRPYLIMMNTRARASVYVADEHYKRALEVVRKGLREIKQFFVRFGQRKAYAHANEVRLLKRFARQIKRHLPIDPLEKLQGELDRAVRDERYEEAARLRDQIERLRPQAQ